MFRQARIRLQILLSRFVRYRHRYINDKNFLILASLITGILSGFAAIALKYLVHLFQHFTESGLDIKYENYLYVVWPLVGIILSVIYIRVFHKGVRFDKGLSSIIHSISRQRSNLDPHKTYSHVITAALTTGFGGSVGLEAPIAVTGSAIGSNTARTLLLSRQEKTLLLASGAAAGIAAIFNSPIAGVVFAFEVLLSEVSIAGFIPLLIASASGAVISKIFYSGQLFFLTTEGWELDALPFYTLMGAGCGLLSVYMVRTTLATEGFFHRCSQPYIKALAGGLIIGLLIFLFPPLYGEGYGVVNDLMAGDYKALLNRSLFFRYQESEGFILLFAAALVLVKVFAAATTVGSGGNGGIFGPSLLTGALFGFVFSHGLNFAGLAELNEKNFIAAAMGGLISGVMHAPLTGIFLIAEITGGYVLFVPLMLVSAASFFVTRYFEPYSIYTKTLIERGMLGRSADAELLGQLSVRDMIETGFAPVSPAFTLGRLVEEVARSKRNIFPVVDDGQRLNGVIILDDIREIMFKNELYDKLTVRELMSIPPVVATLYDPVEMLMLRFDEYGVWNIPVVDDQERYIGFVSRSGILNRYRDAIVKTRQAPL